MSSNSLIEPAIITYIALLGALTIRLRGSSPLQIFRQFALALPLGCCYTVAAGIISLALFSKWLPWFVLLAPLVPCLWAFRKFSSDGCGRTALSGSVVLICYFLFSALLRSLNIAIFSYDSFQFVFLSSGYAHSTHLAHFADFFFSYASFIVALQALVQFFGEDYASTGGPLFILCALSYTLMCLLGHIRGSKPLIYLAAGLLTMLAITCIYSPYFVIHQVFYVNNHRFHGCMMFLAVMEICSFAETKNPSPKEQRNYYLTIFGLLGGVVFSRIEGPLAATLLLVLLAETKKLSGKQFALGTMSFMGFYLVWTLLLWRYRHLSGHVAPIGSFITPFRMLELMVPSVLLCGAYSQQFLRRSTVAWRYVVILTLLGSLIVHASTRPQHYAETVSNSLNNLLFLVPWGAFWPIAGLTVCYSLCTSRNLRESCISFVLIAYPLILLTLSAFRTPYRQGWGDSGNRMMGHMIPFVAYIVIFKALEAISVASNQDSPAAPHLTGTPRDS
jgi:hypothetical protein